MSIGPYLCGDTHCPSCGPAQGNWQCPICGSWADDTCEHIGEDGNIKPEFQAKAEEIVRSIQKHEEQLAVEYQEEDWY